MIDENELQPEHRPESLGTITEGGTQTTTQYFQEHLEREKLGIEAPMW